MKRIWGERGRRSRHYQSQEVQQARVTSIYIFTPTQPQALAVQKGNKKKDITVVARTSTFFYSSAAKGGHQSKTKAFFSFKPDQHKLLYVSIFFLTLQQFNSFIV